MERTKENTLSIFMHMIYNSWTYERMTADEQERLEKAVDWADSQGMIKGSFDKRWKVLQAIYNAFLQGIGFSGHLWREPNPEEIPFVCGE